MQNFAKPVFILIAGLSLSGLFACGLNSQVKVTISSGVCSAGSIEASCAAQSSTALSLTGRRPLAIKSGDTVTLTGTGFNKAMSATIGGIPVTSLNVTSATSASLVVPPGVATGMSDLKLALTAAEATASVAYMPSSEMQLFTGSVSEICAGVEFYDLNGDKQTGTKSCSTPECTANGSVGAESHSNCASDGAIGCVVVGPTYAAAVTASAASKILSGQSVAGVSGNITLPSAGKVLTGISYGVPGNGSTGTLTIPAAGNVLSTAPAYGDPGAAVTGTLTSPDPWDVRAGISAAGVSGQLKTNCRNGGSTLTFGMGAIKSATVANGADTLTVTSHGYQTGTVVWIDYTTQPTGLSRLTNYYVIRVDNNSFKLATSAANAFNATPVATDITADGLGVIVWQAGATAKPATAVDPTNYTISVTGHGYSSTQVVQVSYTTWPGGPSTSTNYYVIVVDKDTIKLATSPSNAKYGVAIHITTIGSDVYVYSLGTGTLSVSDTIEDFNSFGEILTSHPWSSSNNFCDGVEAIAGDSNVWKDTSGGGCANNSSNCRMKDKISGLEWTKMQSVSLNWGKAMDLCNGLTVDSVPGWRLPTQKELMDAYNHGIRSAGSTNWISKSTFDANYFWSASTVSANFGGAWSVHLAYGRSNDFSKSGTYQVVCVR